MKLPKNQEAAKINSSNRDIRQDRDQVASLNHLNSNKISRLEAGANADQNFKLKIRLLFLVYQRLLPKERIYPRDQGKEVISGKELRIYSIKELFWEEIHHLKEMVGIQILSLEN